MTYIPTRFTKEIHISELITIHYFEYMNNFVFHGESHDFWEFLYVDQGCITVKTDTSSYQLNTGDIVFHKPNEFHAIQANGSTSPNLVAISFKSDSSAIDFFHEKTFSLNSYEKRLISRIIEEAHDAFSTPLHLPSVEQIELKDSHSFGSFQLIQLYLELFLITIRRNHSKDHYTKIMVTFDDHQDDISPKGLLFHEILNYMECHICEQLTITQICTEFSISRSTLHTLFHSEKSCGAIDHFNARKISRSKDIIRAGNMNLTEIAHFLSYSSLQHFSKQFKLHTGISPTKYATSVRGISKAVEEATSCT
ncbi:MAG: AraC family transcriptional regulator [Eubacteriales bacterium]